MNVYLLIIRVNLKQSTVLYLHSFSSQHATMKFTYAKLLRSQEVGRLSLEVGLSFNYCMPFHNIKT